MLPALEPGAEVSGVAGFTLKERERNTNYTSESRDSAAGLLTTTISIIGKFSPSPGRNSVLCFAGEELETPRD